MPADSSNSKMSTTSVIRVQVPDCSSQSSSATPSSSSSLSLTKPRQCPANHTADPPSIYHHPYHQVQATANSSDSVVVTGKNHHDPHPPPPPPPMKMPPVLQSAQSSTTHAVVIQHHHSHHHQPHHHMQSSRSASENNQTIIVVDPASTGGSGSVGNNAMGHSIVTTQRVPHSNVIYVNNSSVLKNNSRNSSSSNNCGQSLGSSCVVSTSESSASVSQMQQRPQTPEYIKSYPVMDTTVASSVKGEPELNIGAYPLFSIAPSSSVGATAFQIHVFINNSPCHVGFEVIRNYPNWKPLVAFDTRFLGQMILRFMSGLLSDSMEGSVSEIKEKHRESLSSNLCLFSTWPI